MTFVGSAVRREQYPRDGLPEVALLGRSNVGKSSLLNALAGGRPLARVSAQPGRTQTVNFFRVENEMYLADLPGYGYARVPEAVWSRTALLWLNSPHNPTGATLGRDALARVAALARHHGFWVAADEAYAEIWFDAPPHSMLECGLDNVIALHTLSKRSAMTGFRSGFMAGDERLIDALRRFRPNVGVATPEFVQQAAIVAWNDDAHAALTRYIAAHERNVVHRYELDDSHTHGLYVAPTIIELPRAAALTREVFGPVLHVVRYDSKRVEALVDEINGLGYGLTLGVHTRIDATATAIAERARAGNVYVNRNMIGAVVGVQPFGGEGLSGTGPKAGGPHYLYRFCAEQTLTINTAAAGGNVALLALS